MRRLDALSASPFGGFADWYRRRAIRCLGNGTRQRICRRRRFAMTVSLSPFVSTAIALLDRRIAVLIGKPAHMFA